MNKKETGFLWSYQRSTLTDIYQAYKNPSYAKVKAFKNCRADMEAHDGYDFRITGKSCDFFSCAFCYVDHETHKEHLRYHTYARVYDFEI